MYLECSIFIHTFNLLIFFKFFVCVVFEFIQLPYWLHENLFATVTHEYCAGLWAPFEFSIGAFNTLPMFGTGPFDRVFLSVSRLNWTLCLSILFCGIPCQLPCLSFRGSALGSPANWGGTWFSFIWSLQRSLGRGRSGAVSALSS